METVEPVASARRGERLGSWMFWGVIVGFEMLGVFLAGHPQWTAEDLADEEAPTMPTLLIVEDNANQRLLYREEFERDGYAVLEARDGREALARIDHDAPDAVVLDIDIPALDRLHTLERIHDRSPTLPVILNSAYAYGDQLVGWLIDAAITKSASLDELKQTVDTVLAQKHEKQIADPEETDDQTARLDTATVALAMG